MATTKTGKRKKKEKKKRKEKGNKKEGVGGGALQFMTHAIGLSSYSQRHEEGLKVSVRVRVQIWVEARVQI